MTRFQKLALPLAAALLLAACGTAETASPVTTDPATGIEIPTGSPTASAPTVIAPLILDATTTSGSVAVGNTVVFNLADPAGWSLSADRPELVLLKSGLDDGSMVLNPGATALAAGTVVVTATGADGETTIEFTIEIR